MLERTLRKNDRFQTGQTSLEIKMYWTQMWGRPRDGDGGYLKAEQAPPCLCRAVKMMMMIYHHEV